MIIKCVTAVGIIHLAITKCVTADGIMHLANIQCVTAAGVIDLAIFKTVTAGGFMGWAITESMAAGQIICSSRRPRRRSFPAAAYFVERFSTRATGPVAPTPDRHPTPAAGFDRLNRRLLLSPAFLSCGEDAPGSGTHLLKPPSPAIHPCGEDKYIALAGVPAGVSSLRRGQILRSSRRPRRRSFPAARTPQGAGYTCSSRRARRRSHRHRRRHCESAAGERAFHVVERDEPAKPKPQRSAWVWISQGARG